MASFKTRFTCELYGTEYQTEECRPKSRDHPEGKRCFSTNDTLLMHMMRAHNMVCPKHRAAKNKAGESKYIACARCGKWDQRGPRSDGHFFKCDGNQQSSWVPMTGQEDEEWNAKYFKLRKLQKTAAAARSEQNSSHVGDKRKASEMGDEAEAAVDPAKMQRTDTSLSAPAGYGATPDMLDDRQHSRTHSAPVYLQRLASYPQHPAGYGMPAGFYPVYVPQIPLPMRNGLGNTEVFPVHSELPQVMPAPPPVMHDGCVNPAHLMNTAPHSNNAVTLPPGYIRHAPHRIRMAAAAPALPPSQHGHVNPDPPQGPVLLREDRDGNPAAEWLRRTQNAEMAAYDYGAW